MKGFVRKDTLFSLCGLNCGLCSMHTGGYCPGCGQGEGNQTCKLAKCSLSHGEPSYCFTCHDYPCFYYETQDDYDIFISRLHVEQDIARFQAIGAEYYHKEQRYKQQILQELLVQYNDGRKKTL